MKEYELYHHGVKGQKWGVRRERRLQKNRKARSDRADAAIKKSGGSKAVASARRVAIGALRYKGQN